EQAFAALAEGFDRAAVDRESAGAAGGAADPAFARTGRLARGGDEGADLFAGKNGGEYSVAAAAGDDYLFAGGRDEPGRLEFACHAPFTELYTRRPFQFAYQAIARLSGEIDLRDYCASASSQRLRQVVDPFD